MPLALELGKLFSFRGPAATTLWGHGDGALRLHLPYSLGSKQNGGGSYYAAQLGV